VGMFVSIALVILLLGVFTLGGQHGTFVNKAAIRAVLDNINGLKNGDNVWLSGVKVGVIKNIDIKDEGVVLIPMNIEKKVEAFIHKDAKVRIGSDGLVGNTIIIIHGGTNKSPLITSQDILLSDKTAGAQELLSSLNESSKNLQVITNNLMGISKNLLYGKGTLNTLLNDSGLSGNVKLTVSDLKLGVAHFKRTAIESEIVLTDLARFSAHLNQEGMLPNDLVSDTIIFNNLRTTVTTLRRTMDTLSQFSNNMKKASTALTEKENTAGEILNDTQDAAHLKSMVLNLDSASDRLKEDLEAIQHNFLFRRYFKKKMKTATRH